jgi:GTP cyclohydrolase I
MAKKQTSAAKRKRVQVKVPKKLYKALRKEAKKKDVAVSELALAISERGIRKEKKSKA